MSDMGNVGDMAATTGLSSVFRVSLPVMVIFMKNRSISSMPMPVNAHPMAVRCMEKKRWPSDTRPSISPQIETGIWFRKRFMIGHFFSSIGKFVIGKLNAITKFT
jgi:hypothetical protein